MCAARAFGRRPTDSTHTQINLTNQPQPLRHRETLKKLSRPAQMREVQGHLDDQRIQRMPKSIWRTLRHRITPRPLRHRITPKKHSRSSASARGARAPFQSRSSAGARGAMAARRPTDSTHAQINLMNRPRMLVHWITLEY